MPRTKGPPARSVTFRLRRPYYDVLDALAKAQGMEVSSLLNHLVARYLAWFSLEPLGGVPLTLARHEAMASIHESVAACHRSISRLELPADEGGVT